MGMFSSSRTMADSSAFAKIVDGHHAEIRRYLRRAAPHRADADALCEETFVRAFRAHRSLTADVDVRAWLFAIATRSLSDTSIGAQVIARQVGERTAVRRRRPDTGRRGLRHPNVEPSGTGNRTSRGRAAPRPRHAEAPPSGLCRHRRVPRLLGGDRADPRARGHAQDPPRARGIPCRSRMERERTRPRPELLVILGSHAPSPRQKAATVEAMPAMMTADVLLVPITLVGVVLAWAESDPPSREPGRQSSLIEAFLTGRGRGRPESGRSRRRRGAASQGALPAGVP